MNSEVKVCNEAKATTAKSRGPVSNVYPTGRFTVEHWRDGEKIAEYYFHNAVTTEGKNLHLSVMFKGGTEVTAWYLGLISSTSYTALALTDTYANINQTANGWTEFASYTDTNNSASATTRPLWNSGTVSAATLTASSTSIFTVTAAGTVKGVFCVGGTNAQTKSDYTSSGNTLWATALFTAGDVTVVVGDELKVTYTVSEAS